MESTHVAWAKCIQSYANHECTHVYTTNGSAQVLHDHPFRQCTMHKDAGEPFMRSLLFRLLSYPFHVDICSDSTWNCHGDAAMSTLSWQPLAVPVVYPSHRLTDFREQKISICDTMRYLYQASSTPMSPSSDDSDTEPSVGYTAGSAGAGKLGTKITSRRRDLSSSWLLPRKG